MNYRFTAKLACRIMAIYFFIISLQHFPGFIASMIYFREQTRDAGYNIVITLVMLLPVLAASILLWTFADNISMKIVKESEEGIEANTTNYRNAAILAFALMGMFVLTNAIPAFTISLIEYKLIAAQDINQSSAYFSYLARVIGDGVKILLGLWLLLGARGITNIIRVLRELGKDTIEIPKE